MKERKKIKIKRKPKAIREILFDSPKYVENTHTLEGHSGAIYDVIFENNQLFTSSADKFVVEWDLTAYKQKGFTVKLEKSAYAIAYAPKHNLLAIGTNNGGIHIVNTESRVEEKLLTQHKDSIFSLVYSPRNDYFLSADRDGYLCVWNGKDFKLLLTYPFGCGKIREITLSENENFIALACQDGIVRIMDCDSLSLIQELHTSHNEGVNCTLFNGAFLFTGGKDAFIRKWNWKEGKQLLNIPGHNYAVYDMELIDNRNKIVSVSFDKTIKIWNANDLTILERIEYKNTGHRHTVNRIVKLSEHSFITVSDDRKIKMWELKQNS